MEEELASLTKSEFELRTLIEQVPSVIYSVSFTQGVGKVSYISPQIKNFLGFAPEEWSNTPGLWEKQIYPQDAEKVILDARQCREEGRMFQAEYRILTRDDRIKWIHDESAILRDEKGSISTVLGSWYDITQLRRTEEQSRTLASLGHKLSAARTPHDVGMVAAETADALMGWDAFYINMYSQEEDVAYSVINIDSIGEERREFPSIYDNPTQPSPMFNYILKNGPQLILREKPDEDAALPLLTYRENPQRSASLMFVPIREKGEKIIGQMSIQSYSFNAYDKNDLELFLILSNHCSGALERAFAEEKLHRTEERAAGFASLAHRLNSVHAAHEAGFVIAETADRLLGWDACNINLFDPGKNEIRAVLNIDTIKGVKKEVPLIRMEMTPMTHKVLKEGAQLILRDAESSIDTTNLFSFGDTTRPSRSLMFVPVRKGENGVGTISIQSYAPLAYTKADLQTLQDLADHCSSALERIQAERSLVEERNLLSVMLDNLPQYLYIKDTQSRFLTANRQLWTALGMSSMEDIVGKTDKDFSTPEEADFTFREERELFQTGRPVIDKKISFIDPSTGRQHWLSINKVPLKNQEGQITGLLGFNTEYTDRKRMEDQQEAFIRLGNKLSAASTPREAGKIIVDVAQYLIGWDSCFVFLYQKDKKLPLLLLSIDTIDGRKVDLSTDTFTGEIAGYALKTIREGRQFVLREKDKEDAVFTLMFGDESRRSASLLYVPIRKGDLVIGVLSIQSYKYNAYIQQDMDLLDSLAHLCAEALVRIQAQEEMRLSEERMSIAKRFGHIGIWDKDLQSGLITWSDTTSEIFGVPLEQFDGSREMFLRMVHPEDRPALEQVMKECMQQGGVYEIEHRITLPDNNIRWVVERGNVLRSEKGEPLRMLGVCVDITDRKRMEEALRESEDRYALALQGANDGIWDWSLTKNEIYFSHRWKAMLGFGEEEIGNRIEEWDSRIHPKDLQKMKEALNAHFQGETELFQHENRIRNKEGKYIWVLCRGAAIRDASGRAIRMAGSMTDVTDRKNAEEQLAQAAFYDSLTNLPNRALLTDRLERCVAHSKRRTNYIFSVMFLDLDRFKMVNDSLGHLMGDKLLIEVGKRLREIVREGDTVARLGGDEFTILLDDLKENNQAIHVAERIIQELSCSFIIDEQEIFTSASIGIVISTGDYENMDELLRDADTALYRAKERGRGCFVIFDQQMHDAVMVYLDIENGLRTALSNNEFRLYYQPIISIKSGNLCGVEALIRWQHPQKGLLSPKSFIPISEESGLIISIGEWVIREACRQMALWCERFPKVNDLFMSVNISARQFSSPALGFYVEDILTHYNLDPQRFHLEITEAALLKEPDHILPILSRWRRKGILILLDDFGTGFYPLGRLTDFPIDFLKIDRSFISGLEGSAESRHIVRAMISLARVLNIHVVAKGAETKTQMDALSDMECEYVQGFYISHPLTSQEMENYLKP